MRLDVEEALAVKLHLNYDLSLTQYDDQSDSNEGTDEYDVNVYDEDEDVNYDYDPLMFSAVYEDGSGEPPIIISDK